MSNELKECRICFTHEETDNNPLISPCQCNGTSKFVHKLCLNEWRNFNRGREAWTKCMECKANYLIYRKYPEETFFYPTSKKLPLLYFVQSFTAFCCGLLLWTIEYHTDYLAIKILNFDQNIHDNKFLKSIKNDNDLIVSQIFYYSYSYYLHAIFFHIYFYFNYYNYVKNKKIYIQKIKTTAISSFIVSINFLYLYYFFIWNDYPMIFYNLSTVFTFITPYVNYLLMVKHNKILLEINFDNQEEILSYTNNPLLQDNRNENFHALNIILR